MSKCVTMYEENKPSTLINDVQERLNFFRAILVRSAMPNTCICNNNKAPETGEWVCGVGVGVRRGLRGASVPRWSA